MNSFLSRQKQMIKFMALHIANPKSMSQVKTSSSTDKNLCFAKYLEIS